MRNADRRRPRWNWSTPSGRRHLAVARAVIEPDDADELCEEIDQQFEGLGAVVRSLAVLREVAPRSLDAVASIGEILSSRIVAAALVARGFPAVWLDPRELIVTDNSFTIASPLMPQTFARLSERLDPLIAGRACTGHRWLRCRHTRRDHHHPGPGRVRLLGVHHRSRYSPPTRSRSGPTSTAC